MLTVYVLLQMLIVNGEYIGSVPVPYVFYSMAACEDSKMPFASTHPPKDENTKHAYVCTEYNPQVN
jgi:hypothetical protein